MNPSFNPDTRASLIARICDCSDQTAWSEFYIVYQPVIQRFIAKYALQHADAAEVVQEVLVQVAKSVSTWDGTDPASTFRGWLFRVTRNLAIDYLRKKQKELGRTQGVEAGLCDIAEVTESESQAFRLEYERQLFHRAAEILRPTFKPKNWQAFWMTTVEGFSIEEVAERLEMECGAIYVARSRIMARLAKHVQEQTNEIASLPEYRGEQL